MCRAGVVLVDTQDLDLDEITEHLVRAHGEGRAVVRLCSGDPSVYSAIAEQTARLTAAGVPWDITPGVPAFAAAAAALGVELTVPHVTQSVVLTRPRRRSTPMPESEALTNFTRTRATLALHLGIGMIDELVPQLVPDYGDDCPVAVVYRVSQPSQIILRGSLATIVEQVRHTDIRQAAIILVGPVLNQRADQSGPQSFLYSPARTRRTD